MPAHILLVDDELHILKAAEFKFKRQGYHVACASDGLDAWEKVQVDRPDLIVTDLQMPRMNGLQLIERLRGDERFVDLPAILLTAKGFELDVADITARLRVHDIVSKPFSPRDLCKRVEMALAERGDAKSPSEAARPDQIPSRQIPSNQFPSNQIQTGHGHLDGIHLDGAGTTS